MGPLLSYGERLPQAPQSHTARFADRPHTMSDLTFRRLDEAALHLYQTWFQDAELSRRIERPARLWFDYVTTTPGCYGWMIYDGDLPVGQMQLDTDAGQTGYIGLVVNPALRRQGWGKRILRAFLQRPEAMGLRQIEATSETDNIACLRCLHQVGFSQVSSELDAEGFLHFTFTMAARAEPGP